jgi:hypothetical protein
VLNLQEHRYLLTVVMDGTTVENRVNINLSLVQVP